ncbi:50S ribosomal protein L11 methyltransferase [Candidatus Nomurabacteria bacterium]|nr:50S ribosomal protein L11 methyltransferase [Candidatus Nomurabacteria bacterium]
MTHTTLPYKPFNNETQHLAIVDTQGKIKELKSIFPKYKIKIKPKGHLPKTGCLMADVMKRSSFKSLITLDIGTGESGFLALNMAALGARRTIAIDVDNEAIKWARLNIRLNHFEKKVSLENYDTDIIFDIITANLPQIPSNSFGSSHDDGGPDGRKFINQAIEFSSKHLKTKGRLYLTAFDFLGVEKKLNKNNTILNCLQGFGFKAKVAKRQLKEITLNSYTAKKLSWIKKQYPLFNFHPTKSSMGKYNVLIIEAIKN